MFESLIVYHLPVLTAQARISPIEASLFGLFSLGIIGSVGVWWWQLIRMRNTHPGVQAGHGDLLLPNKHLLSLLFRQSIDGFFFMALTEPVGMERWGRPPSGDRFCL